MKPTVLLMFSGGLDSTGAFWQLLQNKFPIYVHHMHLKNIENRYDAEKNAVNNILKYMSNFGEFIYSESFHEYPVFNKSFIWDGDLSSFMSGTICECMPWIKQVAMGRTASDNTNTASVSRIQKSNKIFESICKATKIYPVQNLTKKEIYEMLPYDLRILSWSCRKPIYYNNDILPCCKCKTCYEMQQMNIKQQKQTNQTQLSQLST